MSRTDPLSNQYAPLPMPATTASWREFCATVVDRIEAIRANEAPRICPTCSTPTTTETPPPMKWCGACRQWRFRATDFSRDRTHGDGLAGRCRTCRAAEEKIRRSRKAIYALRRAS